jgi:hypothetical protein
MMKRLFQIQEWNDSVSGSKMFDDIAKRQNMWD